MRLLSVIRWFIYGLPLLALLSGCGPAAHRGPTPPEPKVSGDTVILQTNCPQMAALNVEPIGATQPSLVPLTGRLVWDEDVTVRVFTPFAGIVRKLFVDVNQPVSQGAPLAEVQSSDFGQAMSDLRKAQADYRRTELNLSRVRDLYEHGAAPRKDLESAEADYASARAEQERAENRLLIYGVSPVATNRDFLLPSPLKGIVVERNINPGQEIRPDQILANAPQFTAPLFTITDPARLWVWLDITEMQLPLVHLGQELQIRSRAFPDQVFTGRLDLIGNSLDPTTRTVRARGTVENQSQILKAELYVTVEIPDAVPRSLQVPSKAVFLRDNQHYVFVEKGQGEFKKQPVKLGSERDGKVVILDGLKEGERLVTQGCLLLQSVLDEAPKS